jgi:hypothetical protein
MISNAQLLDLIRGASAGPEDEGSQWVYIYGKKGKSLDVPYVEGHRLQFAQSILELSEAYTRQYRGAMQAGVSFKELIDLKDFHMEQNDWDTFLAIGTFLNYWSFSMDPSISITRSVPAINKFDRNKVIIDGIEFFPIGKKVKRKNVNTQGILIADESIVDAQFMARLSLFYARGAALGLPEKTWGNMEFQLKEAQDELKDIGTPMALQLDSFLS